ncbi:MAG: VWA domain-containing protein [Rhizobiales bacterium]|nr:VWA domain-containing protein [Hyphomicrobiales bacterium]MBP9173031.1 VWA domain-containing protein [Hyphomicrobiales bacterium]
MGESPSGKLAANIMHFARVLRGAGLPVGPASVIDALDAALSGSLRTRDEFYWTLHAILVKRREHKEIFDQAFHVFWKKPKMLEQLMQLMFQQITRAAGDKPKDPGFRRLAEAMFDQKDAQSRREKPEALELDATFTASADDILRAKDFEQMTLAEQIQAKEAIARLRLQRREFLTRRFQPDHAGARIDMRRTLRQSLRAGGHMIDLARRAPKIRQRPLVVLCDISGSCSSYSRMFLHFLHGLVNDRTDVTVFLFGTRLTNITRELQHLDVDESIAKVSSAVKDWSGGTRIGATLREFNYKWARRVLTQGADVLLMTDGLERDDIVQLSQEMQRLRRSTKKIVWLNPLLRFDRFEAKASGIRVMMPYVDEFRPVHSLNSLSDLAEALGKRAGPAHDPRKWLKAA